MKKDRIIGDVQLKLVLTGSKKNNKKLDNQLIELKEFISSEVTHCVSDQEIIDPLLLFNGTIQLKNIKSNTKILDISLNDFDFANKGTSQDKINSCILGKLKGFSFKKNFSTPFKAKIIFESY